MYTQFWNEADIIRPISQRFAAEFDIGTSFSDSPDKPNIFSNYTQFSTIFSIHYYQSAKWNFALFGAYFANKYVPEIGQREYPEFRLTGQTVYFFKKIGYILQSRTFVEYRLIQNSELILEDVFRFRERIKFTKPIRRKIIRRKTYYAIVSEEIYLKTPSDITGIQAFDRNEFSIGLGYAATDNLTLEAYLTNQFLPRGSRNEIYNAIQLKVQINNPFQRLQQKFRKKEE